MKSTAILLCWIALAALAAWLRFERLDDRPIHFDEATGARLLATRLEGEPLRFDPRHYHGPLQAQLASIVCRLRGENTWPELTKQSLRLLPAAAGVLLVLLPLLARRRWGDAVTLSAAAFLATSPLLVYYSRMFIHEMLLAAAGAAFLLVVTGKPKPILAGLLLGVMFAIKETVAISGLAWCAAACVLLCGRHAAADRALVLQSARAFLPRILLGALAGGILAALCYSDFLRHPQGVLDAVKTYFVYETVTGHDKPALYYLRLLGWPFKDGGVWWFGTPVFALATWALAATFLPGPGGAEHRRTIRFLAAAFAGHLVIYSAFSYKTPWLACLPWAHACLLAGFGFRQLLLAGLSLRLPALAKPALQASACLLLAACLASQWRQTRHATGRYASDIRNPFAYVPTSRNAEALAPWLETLARETPQIPLQPIAVIGTNLWPLPWILRPWPQTGYWQGIPENLDQMPLVFAAAENAEAVLPLLESTHHMLPRTLRAGVPVYLFLRLDLWNAWISPEP